MPRRGSLWQAWAGKRSACGKSGNLPTSAPACFRFPGCNLTLTVRAPWLARVDRETPMAFGRRMLRVLLAAAVAFAPLGPVAAVAHANAAPAPAEQASPAAHHHHHGTHHSTMGHMQAVAPEASKAAEPCHGDKTSHRSGKGCCCDDKGSCGAASCLQKCFGQAAVMPSERSQRLAIAQRFLLRPAADPPSWHASPHPPPPRA